MIESKDFLNKILNTMTEQITVINKAGNIIYVNESWIKFSENNSCITKNDEWDKINYLEISDNAAKMGDKLALEASRGIRSVMNGNNSFYLEYPCHSPDQQRWFMLRVTSFELSGHNYYLLSHKNITERKLAEFEVLENHNKLKYTQDIMLRQARNATKGEMLSLIAHHWRQPLSIISAILQNIGLSSDLGEFDLGKKEEATKYQEFVNDSLDEINPVLQKLSDVIKNFQTFHNSDESTEAVTLKEVCDIALNILKKSLSDDKIEIIYDNNSDEKFNLIAGKMAQVIFYIIQNSQENFQAKKTDNPKIKIVIDKEKISICDNGGGIPDNIKDKIFDPYFSTKKELNETGLGLYMSKTIVENHHKAKIEMNNQDGGVCFSIILKNQMILSDSEGGLNSG